MTIEHAQHNKTVCSPFREHKQFFIEILSVNLSESGQIHLVPTYLVHKQEEQPGLEVSCASVEVRSSLKVREACLVIQEAVEGVGGFDDTAQVHADGHVGHERCEDLEVVPGVLEELLAVFPYLQSDVNPAVDDHGQQNCLEFEIISLLLSQIFFALV